MIEYLLKNAGVLKRMDIYASAEGGAHSEEIKAYQRGSVTCYVMLLLNEVKALTFGCIRISSCKFRLSILL